VGLRQPAGIALSLREAFASVPIPKGARPSPDADGHMVILQPSRHRMWEFWQLRHQSGRWHASYGGEMLHVSASAGYFPTSPGWGATATGLPLIGGLMRISELRTGRINHALSMAVPNTKAGVFASPAQRTDGRTFGPTAIPEGTRFRLDPSLDISKLDLSPVMRSIVVAAQRYGMIVTDTGSNVALYAEDPAPKQSNPYSRGGGGLFGDRYPNQLMAEFPWSHLVVVAAPLHTR
jgi:hypothetical protein